MTPYWKRLSDSGSLQDELDNILRQLDVRPVGSGYIDVIAPLDKAQRLLDELSTFGIAVHLVTLWCAASESNKQRYGCPHGMGGPVHGGIWYSEMCDRDPFDVARHGIDISKAELDPFALAKSCNALALVYVNAGIATRPDYSPCLTPGLWLAVPDTWKSCSRPCGGRSIPTIP